MSPTRTRPRPENSALTEMFKKADVLDSIAEEKRGYTKRGRNPKFREKIIYEVKQLSSFGLNLEQIAAMWNVEIRTLTRWGKTHPELYQALKIGKIEADKEVEKSLFKRATGMEVVERYYEVEYTEDHKAIKMMKREVVKQIPPDVIAQIFWLKNRQPDRWRDDHGISLFGKDGEPVSVRYIPAAQFLEMTREETKTKGKKSGSPETSSPGEEEKASLKRTEEDFQR